jgi:hypothetical protein
MTYLMTGSSLPRTKPNQDCRHAKTPPQKASAPYLNSGVLRSASTTESPYHSVLSSTMFANFELYSGGWVTADIKRKRVRTTTGCPSCGYLSDVLTAV